MLLRLQESPQDQAPFPNFLLSYRQLTSTAEACLLGALLVSTTALQRLINFRVTIIIIIFPLYCTADDYFFAVEIYGSTEICHSSNTVSEDICLHRGKRERVEINVIN